MISSGLLAFCSSPAAVTLAVRFGPDRCDVGLAPARGRWPRIPGCAGGTSRRLFPWRQHVAAGFAAPETPGYPPPEGAEP